MKNLFRLLLVILMAFSMASCIEPPLNLPGQQLLVETPQVETELNVVWNVDVDWNTSWNYGWDATDSTLWGSLGYSKPTGYEVRRYYLGDNPGTAHTNVDAFSVDSTSFRRFFEFGYYDMLFWSNIDSPDGSQVLVINETPDSVTATTTGSRGISTRIVTNISKAGESPSDSSVIGLKNQPEIFYSAYAQDINISRNLSDYTYDPAQNIYIKKIETTLRPLVYIYLVQIILYNNDGRVKGINGNSAISSMASGVNVNTGHTNNHPSLVYFNTRLKPDRTVNGQKVDIIGGKLTTFGLCDMEPYTRAGAQYNGGRKDLKDYLYFDLTFSNDGVKTYQYDVTDQCQRQAHGGVITVLIDCSKLTPPDNPDKGTGSLFVPTVEDYDEVYWEVVI